MFANRTCSLAQAVRFENPTPEGNSEASVWARDPVGIGQVGCVYTAQGLEFDYVGVIFGTGLVYDPVAGDWKGVSGASHDSVVKRAKADFTRLVKNTYRILLTRGMKGCYVCFLDKNTEAFFRSRIERSRV